MKAVGNIFALLIGLAYLFVSGIIVFKLIQGPEHFFLTILGLAIFSFISYLMIYSSWIRIRYYAFEKKTRVSFNRKTRNIIVKNKLTGQVQEFNDSDVETVELYDSWNTSAFSSDLAFSKINLKNGSHIFITKSMIPLYEVGFFFKGKVVKEGSKFMNRMR